MCLVEDSTFGLLPSTLKSRSRMDACLDTSLADFGRKTGEQNAYVS